MDISAIFDILCFVAAVSCTIAIRLKIQTKSSHKIHRSELLRLDFVNLNSWIAISAVLGIDSGWAAPALGSGKRNYGLKGFTDGLTAGLLLTLMGGWVVPLYQAVYLIVRLIIWLIK